MKVKNFLLIGYALLFCCYSSSYGSTTNQNQKTLVMGTDDDLFNSHANSRNLQNNNYDGKQLSSRSSFMYSYNPDKQQNNIEITHTSYPNNKRMQINDSSNSSQDTRKKDNTTSNKVMKRTYGQNMYTRGNTLINNSGNDARAKNNLSNNNNTYTSGLPNNATTGRNNNQEQDISSLKIINMRKPAVGIISETKSDNKKDKSRERRDIKTYAKSTIVSSAPQNTDGQVNINNIKNNKQSIYYVPKQSTNTNNNKQNAHTKKYANLTITNNSRSNKPGNNMTSVKQQNTYNNLRSTSTPQYESDNEDKTKDISYNQLIERYVRNNDVHTTEEFNILPTKKEVQYNVDPAINFKIDRREQPEYSMVMIDNLYISPREKAENEVEEIDELEIAALEKEPLQPENIDDIEMVGNERPELKFEGINELEIAALEKEPLQPENIDNIEMVGNERPELKFEGINELYIPGNDRAENELENVVDFTLHKKSKPRTDNTMIEAQRLQYGPKWKTVIQFTQDNIIPMIVDEIGPALSQVLEQINFDKKDEVMQKLQNQIQTNLSKKIEDLLNQQRKEYEQNNEEFPIKAKEVIPLVQYKQSDLIQLVYSIWQLNKSNGDVLKKILNRSLGSSKRDVLEISYVDTYNTISKFFDGIRNREKQMLKFAKNRTGSVEVAFNEISKTLKNNPLYNLYQFMYGDEQHFLSQSFTKKKIDKKINDMISQANNIFEPLDEEIFAFYPLSKTLEAKSKRMDRNAGQLKNDIYEHFDSLIFRILQTTVCDNLDLFDKNGTCKSPAQNSGDKQIDYSKLAVKLYNDSLLPLYQDQKQNDEQQISADQNKFVLDVTQKLAASQCNVNTKDIDDRIKEMYAGRDYLYSISGYVEYIQKLVTKQTNYNNMVELNKLMKEVLDTYSKQFSEILGMNFNDALQSKSNNIKLQNQMHKVANTINNVGRNMMNMNNSRDSMVNKKINSTNTKQFIYSKGNSMTTYGIGKDKSKRNSRGMKSYDHNEFSESPNTKTVKINHMFSSNLNNTEDDKHDKKDDINQPKEVNKKIISVEKQKNDDGTNNN